MANFSLSKIFNGAQKPADWLNSFRPVTRTLPNGGGSYQSPVVNTPTTPTQPAKPNMVSTPPAPVANNSIFTSNAPTAPTPPIPAPVVNKPPVLDYSKYTDPATGKVLDPRQYADMLAARMTGGSVPDYAGNAVTQGPQTTAALTGQATDLNNQRNDIATGATDPYGTASASGIAYSPSELSAIEKAYSGIYDPALKDVFAKLDAKEKADAAAQANKDRESQIRLQASLDAQAPYTLGKDQVRYGADGKPIAVGISSDSSTEPYTVGANPTVDAWAQRIFEGSSKITDIPASDKGLRNAVTVALQAYGNQADGRPTTTEIGLQTLDAAKRLKTMFDEGKGIASVGTSRLFGGGLGVPGSDVANFKNLFETLIANRSLEGIKFLKGQGSVSDAERLTLKSAMSELNLNQSEEEFNKSLQRIIDKLEGNTAKDNSLTTDEIEFLQNKGYTPEQIQEYSKSQGFNSAGNASASKVSEGNRPQRNNNPLNIKSSTFTASLPGVSGTDSIPATDGGKFLTFNDPQAGFEAAKKLITQPSYSNLTIDSALKRWSGGGYGDQIVPQLKGRTISSLSPLELSGLLHTMAKQEGFYS